MLELLHRLPKRSLHDSRRLSAQVSNVGENGGSVLVFSTESILFGLAGNVLPPQGFWGISGPIRTSDLRVKAGVVPSSLSNIAPEPLC